MRLPERPKPVEIVLKKPMTPVMTPVKTPVMTPVMTPVK